MRHLTDEQIQRYLDGDSFHDSDAMDHLRYCPSCRRRLELYRKVYDSLQQDVGFELEPGFAESVVTRLAATSEKSSQVSLAGLILFIFGTILTAGLALYFFSVKTLTEMSTSLPAIGIDFVLSFIQSLKATIASVGVNVGIVLSASLILLTFAAIDRILIRYKGNHYCL